MSEERREYDKRINELLAITTELKVLVKQVHECIFGENGNPGMNREFERWKGGLSVFKWIAGSSGLISISLLIIQIFKSLR